MRKLMAGEPKILKSLARKRAGAGEGNRTLIASLEGWSFTTKLHPLRKPYS